MKQGTPTKNASHLDDPQLLNAALRLARVGSWEIDLAANEMTWADMVHQIHEVEPGYRPTVEAGINFYAPEAIPIISEAVRRAIEQGEPFDVELQLVTARKNRVWVRAVGEAVREDGKVAKVRGVFQDIDARKRAELEVARQREHMEEQVALRTAELAESRDALLEAQRVGRLGNWRWDAVQDVITGSEEFYRLFDVAPAEIARFAQFVELLHPDDRARVQRAVAEAMEANRPYDTDYRVKLRDGSWRYLIARGRVFTDADGNPVRMVGTCLDVTDGKQVQLALEASERRLRDFLDATDSTVTQVDSQGRFLFVNRAGAAMLGLSQQECVGRLAFNFIHPDDRASTQAAFGGWIAAQSTAVTFENRNVSRDGTVHDLLWSISPRYQEGGGLESIWSVATDITDRKRAEAERLRAEEELANSRRHLEMVMDSMDALAYVADMETYELLFLNRFGRDAFPEFEPGRKCYEVLQAGQVGPCEFCTNAMLVDSDGGPTGVHQWEFQNTKTGAWFDCRDRAIRWTDGRLVRLHNIVVRTRRRTQTATHRLASPRCV